MTSKKPVLLVGNGVRAAGAAEKIYKFIEKTSIPVLTTMNAVDLVQDKHKFGFIGTYGNRVANMIIQECDLVISIGARLGLRQIGHKRELFAPNAKLIRVDVDQYELGRTIKDDEEQYHLDANYFFDLLLNEDIPQYNEWYSKCVEIKNLLGDYDDVEGNLCIKKISQLLPVDSIVAVDVGQNQCWAAQSLTLKGTKGRILIGGGYGSMGCGLPFAIGACIAMKKQNIYCIAGDGGFQMNIQELEVIKRENLPVKILILNNKVLGKISEIQHGSYNDRYAQTTKESGYSVPDFEKIANAYGIRAATIKHYSELTFYEDWMKDKEPCLINISLSEDTLLIPKIEWNTCSIKPDLNAEKAKIVESIF